MQNTSLEKTFIHRGDTFMTSMKCPIFAPPPPLVRIGQDPPPSTPGHRNLGYQLPPPDHPYPLVFLQHIYYIYRLYLVDVFIQKWIPFHGCNTLQRITN